MKKTREHDTRKQFMLQQYIRGARGIKRLRGKASQRASTLLSDTRAWQDRECSLAVLPLVLLLFSLRGMVAAITGACALTPNQLSARSLAARSTKTPPARHAPTPTTV